MGSEVIGNQHLLCQSDREDGKAYCNISGRKPVGFCSIKLRHHLFVMQHRACDQMRKIGNEQQIVQKPVFRYLALISVYKERNLCEREKRDADRQNDMQRRQLRVRDVVDAGDKKICIFEVGQQRQVHNHRKRQPARSCGCGGMTDAPSCPIVETN